jgi:GMP synthase (glutamine-hydrolysing)
VNTASHPQRANLGFLLLQVRAPKDPVRDEERDAFAARLGVDSSQIKQIDILNDPLDIGMLADSDAVLVGGAGEFGVLDGQPAIDRMVSFLVGTVERSHPIFASCFGFQALVLGLGGEVVCDEDRAEVGTFVLTAAEAAGSDPVFCALPNQFNAQLGHKDRATRLPQGATLLASSSLCPIQAMHIEGTPVYATQFHPELTWTENRRRFERYMDQYGRLFGEEEAQRRLRGHQPSPEANLLLSRFVDAVLLGDAP